MTLIPPLDEKEKAELKRLIEQEKEGKLSSEETKRLSRLRSRTHSSDQPVHQEGVRTAPYKRDSNETNSETIPDEANPNRQATGEEILFGELVDKAYKSLGVKF